MDSYSNEEKQKGDDDKKQLDGYIPGGRSAGPGPAPCRYSHRVLVKGRGGGRGQSGSKVKPQTVRDPPTNQSGD